MAKKKILRGFSKLSIGVVSENSIDKYTVGELIKIAGAQSFERDPDVEEWEVYADDGIYESGTEWKKDKATITIAELPLSLKKYFEGGTWNEEAKTYTFKSDSEAPELALSFMAKTSDGQYRMYKLFSFKASALKDSLKTKGGGGDAQAVTIEGVVKRRLIDNSVKIEKDTETLTDISWLDTIESLPKVTLSKEGKNER